MRHDHCREVGGVWEKDRRRDLVDSRCGLRRGASPVRTGGQSGCMGATYTLMGATFTIAPLLPCMHGCRVDPGGYPPRPPQIRTCGIPVSYVVGHIRCVMWRAQLCGEGLESAHGCRGVELEFAT